MDNEKIKIYIDDLLKENKCLFAMNESIQERRKSLINELLQLCDGYGTTKDMEKMACLCGRLVGMAMVYRQNRKDIKKNLMLIEGLRNGKINEI